SFRKTVSTFPSNLRTAPNLFALRTTPKSLIDDSSLFFFNAFDGKLNGSRIVFLDILLHLSVTQNKQPKIKKLKNKSLI
ncbi:MAG: hypothetical protein WCS92_04685, partial [Candidatus Babeliales bacterium]